EERQARIQSLMYGDYGSKPVGSGGGNTGSTTESIIDSNAPDAAPAEQGKSQKLDDADLDAFIDGNVKNIGRGEAKDREIKKVMQENIPFDTMNPNRLPGGMMQTQVPMPTSVTSPARGAGGGGLLRRA